MTSQTYPGLRPYKDEESRYFFGRDAQRDEIVLRLGSNQHFVAVVGGSGSGKSSLIRAGVIPKLRNYGLASSGGAWLPIIFTPGTNAETKEQGCLYRMATAMLEACGVCQDSPGFCATQEAFVRTLSDSNSPETLDRLTAQLAEHIPRHRFPAPQETNILYVVDQFEELFHATNRAPIDGKVSDAQLLIQHLVNHSSQELPSNSRAYVVITMRSEHLDECPAYDHLVDVINKGFFLLRNLEDKELALAIKEPARHSLSEKWSKASEDGQNLPDDIKFSEDLMDLLVAATHEVRHNWRQNNQSRGADQLPLLQHALFYIWESAQQRAAAGGFAFPNEVTLDDFAASAGLDETPSKEIKAWRQALRLDNAQPLLAGFLDCICEKIWKSISDDAKPLVELAFRRLAFVDEGGNFTQDRISLSCIANISDDPKRIDEEKKDEVAKIREALAIFIEPHGYLSIEDGNYNNWDRAKVAHESLVRGWRSFGRWVSEEAERYRALDHLIEQARRWNKEGNKFLLSQGDLERAKERDRLSEIFNIEKNWIRFGRFRRTTPHEGADEPKLLRDFLDKSDDNIRNNKLIKMFLVGAPFLLIALVGIAAIWKIDRERSDILARSAEYYRASTIAFSTLKNFSDEHEDFYQPLVPLKQALIAARLFGTTRLKPRTSTPYFKQHQEEQREELSAEGVAARVSEDSLRRILTGTVWPVHGPLSGNDFERANAGKNWCPSPHAKWCLTYVNGTNSNFSDVLKFVNTEDSKDERIPLTLPASSIIRFDEEAGYVLTEIDTRVHVYEVDWASPNLRKVLNIPKDKFNNSRPNQQTNDQADKKLPSSVVVRSWGAALPGVIGNRSPDEQQLPRDKTEDVPVAIAFNAIDESPTITTCEEKFKSSDVKLKTCVEVRYYKNAAYANLFRAPEEQGDMQRLGLLSFNSKNVDRNEKNWKIIDEPLRASGSKRENDENLGWIFIPLNRNGSNHEINRTYLGSPWSPEAWFEIGKKIFTFAGGCDTEPGAGATTTPDLSLRYSVDYELIRKQSKSFKNLETDLCPPKTQ